MSTMTLLIDRRGTELDLQRGVIVVRYPDGTTARVGLHGLQRLILHGEVHLTTRLLRACLETEIGVVLLSARGKQETINLYPLPGRAIHLRHAQHTAFADAPMRLALARHLVAAKIEQQQLWLEAQGTGADLSRFRAATRTASDIGSLMGIEGAASARYFAAWGRLWEPPWEFPRRSRRPPRDPINALLSLSYTLALQYVGRMAVLRGLDTALGFLHTPQPGRPSLALDLLEPVRPWIDQWVWQSLNGRRLLKTDHFVFNRADGCRLNKEGRGLFYAAWHQDEAHWLRRPARNGLALVLNALRSVLTTQRADFPAISEVERLS